jgi:hypothetical protein
LFYQGVDLTTAEVLEAMSQEIQAIGQTLASVLPGFNRQEVAELHQWLVHSYPFSIIDTSTLQASFVTNLAYSGLRAPTLPSDEPGMVKVDLQARYLAEDVPFGLVVAHGIAELTGTPIPVIDRVIEWAQDCLGRQYLVQGALCGQHLAETRAPQAYGISTLEQLIYPLRQNSKYTGEREQVHESN